MMLLITVVQVISDGCQGNFCIGWSIMCNIQLGMLFTEKSYLVR